MCYEVNIALICVVLCLYLIVVVNIVILKNICFISCEREDDEIEMCRYDIPDACKPS